MNHARRRDALMQQLGDGVLVLVAAPERTRSRDTHHGYRPNSDILYLSGFAEPECVLVLAPSHPEHRFVLFVRSRDREREVWEGFRHGPEGAIQTFGADAAFPIQQLEEKLPEYLRGRDTVWYALGEDSGFDRRMLGWIRALGPDRKKPDRAPRAVADPNRLLARMRMRKDPDELEAMATAAAISAAGHVAAMRATRPGLFEYQIQAILEQVFLERGACPPAYGSIVAGGAGACVLHYVANDKPLRDGELLLVDAGAEYRWYAGDITRTWPIARRFSAAQKTLYEAVLDAEEFAIGLVRPGISNHEVHRQSTRRLTQNMVDIGLLRGDVDELIRADAQKRYFMHGTGHYLGMDVHDVGVYLLDEEVGVPYEEGMVLTIEPGIYVPADDEHAPREFRGVGIRIEDDVVVTADGHRVLTGGVPKRVADIEALRGDGAA